MFMHPHPNHTHLMTQYRRHILGCKKKWGSARSLLHYRALVDTYLQAKRHVIINKRMIAEMLRD